MLYHKVVVPVIKTKQYDPSMNTNAITNPIVTTRQQTNTIVDDMHEPHIIPFDSIDLDGTPSVHTNIQGAHVHNMHTSMNCTKYIYPQIHM